MRLIELSLLTVVAASTLSGAGKVKSHTAREKISLKKGTQHVQLKSKSSSHAIGDGYCVNIDTKYPETADFMGGHDCDKLCREYPYFACHGYAAGDGICKLYSSNALQAQHPALITFQEHSLGVKCYVVKQTYNADFPLVAMSAEDFVGCYDGYIGGPGGQNWLDVDYVHAREGDAHGFYASFCARHCQRFKYFLLKAHVAESGRGSNRCFCVERFDHDTNIDRFVGDTYFGVKQGKDRCPSWDCASLPTGCTWQAAWSNHVAIYKIPAPDDGGACPDHQSSRGHQSSYIYLSGSSAAGAYRNATVLSPSGCADLCFREGPSVHGDDRNRNEICHGFYVHRSRQLGDSKDFHCYLYNDPIPHNSLGKYQADTSTAPLGSWNNYLCVLRTCIEETPCVWNMEDNFRRIQGFHYTADTQRLGAGNGTSCLDCATNCASNSTCAAYQCSISTNHCYLFTKVHVDVDIQVSDVSFCAKSSKLPECSYKNGAKAVLSSEGPCRCATEVCTEGEYCVIDLEFGPRCNRDCPCMYSSNTPSVADKVCSTKTVTFASECALRCANETASYPGECTADICNYSEEGEPVAGEPCSCKSSSGKSTRCPVDALCFTNGTCSKSCEELREHVVCGSDGIEYPSRCSMPSGVTLARTGECPQPACAAGQSDCACHGETCLLGPPTTTKCALSCSGAHSLAGSCGCVAPCESIVERNDANTVKSALCGCPTTDEGYMVCDGHCHIHGDGTATCLKACPSGGECVCGDSVCETNRCDTDSNPPTCRQICSVGGTDCACKKKSWSAYFSYVYHCRGGARCFPDSGESDSCLPECKGLFADSKACHCHGSTDNFEVCKPPSSYCSATSGESGGKCVHPRCAAGDSNCICGNDVCLSTDKKATYCHADKGKCYEACAEGITETNCFCPNADDVATNSNKLCLADSEDQNALGNTYCVVDRYTKTSTCKTHCKHTNGQNADGVGCPCGVGVVCTGKEYCLHIDDAESGECLRNPITESCSDVTDNAEEHIGNVPVSKPCFCGGMPCSEGSFCDGYTGTCTENAIQNCDPTMCSGPCRCGNDDFHVVCKKGDICMPNSPHTAVCFKLVDRCQDHPTGTAQSSLGNLYNVVPAEKQGMATKCYCGSYKNAGFCHDGTCRTDRWSDQCNA